MGEHGHDGNSVRYDVIAIGTTPGNGRMSFGPNGITDWNQVNIILVNDDDVNGTGTGNLESWILNATLGAHITVRRVHSQDGITHYEGGHYTITTSPVSIGGIGQGAYQIGVQYVATIGPTSQIAILQSDGITPVRYHYSYVNAGAAGQNGVDGAPGVDGQDGVDGVPGADGALNASRITQIPFARLSNALADEWGSSLNQTQSNPGYEWLGPKGLSQYGLGTAVNPTQLVHPMFGTNSLTSRQLLKEIIWFSPATANSACATKIFEPIPYQGASHLSQPGYPYRMGGPSWRAAGYIVADRPGVILGLNVTCITPYNSDVYYTNISGIPIVAGVGKNAGPNGALGVYKWFLTGSFVTPPSYGVSGPVPITAHQSFFPWPNPPTAPAPEGEDKAWALYFEPGDILICGMGYGRHPVSGGKAYTKEGISHVTLQIKYDES